MAGVMGNEWPLVFGSDAANAHALKMRVAEREANLCLSCATIIDGKAGDKHKNIMGEKANE